MSTSLIAYILAAALLTVTPGVDTALVLRTAVVEGKRSAALAGVGIALGCLVWGFATAAGLGVIFAASELAYTIVKWAGAAYLAWLGIKLLTGRPEPADEVQVQTGKAGSKAFSRGLLTNLLNPKVGIFYISFLPQFIPEGVPVAPYSMLLTAIHAGLGLLWFAILITLTAPLTELLRRPRVIRWIDRVTGAVFLAFAVRLAVDRRA